MGKSKKRVDVVDAERIKKDAFPKMAPVPDPQLQSIVEISCSCSTMEELVERVSSFVSELKSAGFLPCTEEKNKIKARLLVFNSNYRDIAEPKHNHLYFSKLSVLLAQYIGLEILTSEDAIKMERREGQDLISRVVTTLYTLLDKSEEHMLDTILRLKAPLEEGTPRKDVALYTLLFREVVKKALTRKFKDLIYIRCVLVCRLWKKLVKEDTREKERVIKFALKRLKPPPGFAKRRTPVKILPKPPKGTKNITEFFLRERYNVRRTVQRFLEFASKAANAPTMFPNLSCDPRLLSPKVRKFGPIPAFAAPVQEFSTCQDLTEGLAWRLRCEEPPSEARRYEQVTRFRNIPKCTDTRLSNLLNSHHLRDKPQKVKAKKKSVGETCSASRHAVRRIRNGGVAARAASHDNDVSECGCFLVPQTPPKSQVNSVVGKRAKSKSDSPEAAMVKKVKTETWAEENHSLIHVCNSYPRKKAFVLPFNGHSAERAGDGSGFEVRTEQEEKAAAKEGTIKQNGWQRELSYSLSEPEKLRKRSREEDKTQCKADLPPDLSSLNVGFPKDESSDVVLDGFDAESLRFSLGYPSDVPPDPIWGASSTTGYCQNDLVDIMAVLDQCPASSVSAISAKTSEALMAPVAVPSGMTPKCESSATRLGLLKNDETGVGALKARTDDTLWEADFAAYSIAGLDKPGTASDKDLASHWNQLPPEFTHPAASHSDVTFDKDGQYPVLDADLDHLNQLTAGLIDQSDPAWVDPLYQVEDEWFRDLWFQQPAQSEMTNLLSTDSKREFPI